MTIIKGARLYEFNQPGSMGIVNDTQYINCFWPKLDSPVALFERGSSGIKVEGPPTPRNVIFPDDTVFLNGTRGDCFFLREKVKGEHYVAELSPAVAIDLTEEKKTIDEVKVDADFIHYTESKEDPSVVPRKISAILAAAEEQI